MCKGRFNVILVFLIVWGPRYNVNPQFFSDSVHYTVCMQLRQVRFYKNFLCFFIRMSFIMRIAHVLDWVLRPLQLPCPWLSTKAYAASMSLTSLQLPCPWLRCSFHVLDWVLRPLQLPCPWLSTKAIAASMSLTGYQGRCSFHVLDCVLRPLQLPCPWLGTKAVAASMSLTEY